MQFYGPAIRLHCARNAYWNELIVCGMEWDPDDITAGARTTERWHFELGKCNAFCVVDPEKT